MSRARTPLPLLLLGLLTAATLLHAVTMLEGDADQKELAGYVLYYGVMFGGGAAMLLRAALVSRDRLAWALLGLGILCRGTGDAIWDVIWGEGEVPYPSVADFVYLAHYPVTVAGLIVLAGERLRRMRGTMALDAVVSALGAAAVVAALLGPALSMYAASNPIEAAINVAYPIADLVLVATTAAVAIAVGLRRDFLVLAAGLVALTVADTLYLHTEATSGYEPNTLLDTGWMLAAALGGWAAWVRATWIGRADQDREWIALPAVASLASIALLLRDHFASVSTTAAILAAVTLALAVARLLIAFAENSRLLARAQREALTDSLTGLGNRRQLIRDLDRTCARALAGRGRYLFAIYDLNGFKHYNDTFGHAAGDHLLRRLGGELSRAVSGRGTAYRLGGDEFCILAPVASSGDAEAIVAAARDALYEEGQGFSIDASYGAASIPGEAAEPSEALRLADRRMYAEKGRAPRSFELQARDLLLGVLREREPGLGEHMEGVGRLAAELARRAGLDNEDIDVIARAADLHDIGKMGVPERVLGKPGPLDPEEWSLMRKHTLIGERMLSVSPALGPVARLIRSSHERWDGRGYPDGLAGEEIPIGARIIAICDAFEAMTEERPYRKPVSIPEALAELRRNAGTQFDPNLVELFAEVVTDLAQPARQRQ